MSEIDPRNNPFRFIPTDEDLKEVDKKLEEAQMKRDQVERILQHSEVFNRVVTNSVLLELEAASEPEKIPKPIKHIIEDVAEIVENIGESADRLGEMAEEQTEIIEKFKNESGSDE